jgi:hypothetical protein
LLDLLEGNGVIGWGLAFGHIAVIALMASSPCASSVALIR